MTRTTLASDPAGFRWAANDLRDLHARYGTFSEPVGGFPFPFWVHVGLCAVLAGLTLEYEEL